MSDIGESVYTWIPLEISMSMALVTKYIANNITFYFCEPCCLVDIHGRFEGNFPFVNSIEERKKSFLRNVIAKFKESKQMTDRISTIITFQ
jgi:hypothetical protein